MAKLLKLNAENYFSEQANRDYYSVSQIKSFLDCPVKTMAELNGEYVREQNTGMLVGSYVDSWFSGEF